VRVGAFEQVPVQAGVVVPFAALRELAAHEQQLLARVAPHEAVEQAQVGELLPASPGILASSEPLPCTTSSCDSGSTKFSLKAYTSEKRQLVVVVLRCTGSRAM
jgi:hypothetical protein